MSRDFRLLRAAYTVSAYGSGLGFGALPLIAVLVLHATPGEVSLLAAAGPAAGAVLALPLGPWAEFRRKRPVMIAMDALRCVAMLSVPVAYALGDLTLVQLLVVSAVLAAAKIAFAAASGAVVKAIVPAGGLVAANGRFEAATWGSIAVGPPLGAAAIGVFGPVATVLADAASYLLSALGIAAMRTPDPPRPPAAGRVGAAGLLDGWRHIFGHCELRRWYLNQLLVAALIMATEPLLAVLMLGELGFPPWQWGLAFALPCLGGLAGSRLAARAVARVGRYRLMRLTGVLRAIWLGGLACVGPGAGGLVTVIVVELAIIVNMSLFNPALSAYRLEHTPPALVARTLSAWSIGSGAAIAVGGALFGLLADAIGPRSAIAVAGGLILLSPLLLPRVPAGEGDRDVQPSRSGAG